MKKTTVPDTDGKPTPEFVRAVKDHLEVMTGRRRNRITLPTLQLLTFSNPPTQAECNALLAYTNAWAVVIKALVGRLDE